MTNYLGICLVTVYYKDGKDIKINFLLTIIHDIFFLFSILLLNIMKLKLTRRPRRNKKKKLISSRDVA